MEEKKNVSRRQRMLAVR